MGLEGLVDLMIISNESMDFNDPKELNDPNYSMIPDIPRSQLFNDQLEVWTLIIQKCTVIPPSLMVLFFFLPMFNLFVIVDCVTPSLASQVIQKTCWFFRAQVFSGKFYLFESPIILAPRTFYCLKPVKSK